MWWSMPIFSFMWYTLTEVFWKTDNWWQIYEQRSSTFIYQTIWPKKKLLLPHNKVAKYLFNYFLKKIQNQPPEVERQSQKGFCKNCVLKNFANFTEKHLCCRVIFNKVASLQPAIFLKRDSYSSAFLRCFHNF